MPYQRSPILTIDTRTENRFHMNFKLSNTDVSVANAIRRVMIAEVPTMAINLVEVYENTSALADEYIVHRLGLIPLDSEHVDRFEYAQDCEDCDDVCHKCSVTYTLNKECMDETLTITSRDLKIESAEYHNVSVVPVHDSGDVEPKPLALVEIQNKLKDERQKELFKQQNHPQYNQSSMNQHQTKQEKEDDLLGTSIVIAKLSKGQKIHMKCIVRKGIGKDHAKHSPMCTVSYRIYPPAVELNLDKINVLYPPEAKNKFLHSSSGLLCLDEATGNLKYEQPFHKGRIAVNPDTCRKAGELAVLHGGKAHEVVILNPHPQYFEFIAETTGAMTPRQALGMALEILDQKAGNVLAHLS